MGVAMQHDYCSFCFKFLRSVFAVEMRRRKISLQSFMMLLYSAEESRLVSLSRSSQYSVSAASLRAIVVLTRNSFLLTEYWASLRFAPIEVPERNNCFASMYSRFSSQRCLHRLYILIANLRLFSKAIFISQIYKRQGEKANEVLS